MTQQKTSKQIHFDWDTESTSMSLPQSDTLSDSAFGERQSQAGDPMGADPILCESPAARSHQPLSREEAQKHTETALCELSKELEQGKSDTLIKYLSTLSRFHRYSFGNCMLIAIQMPDATHVAGFHRWKELGRSVKNGEHGIAILAPLIRSRKPESDATEDGKDKQTTDRNRRLFGFRVVRVFDVLQTEGKDLPQFTPLSGNPGKNLETLECLVSSNGIQLLYEHIQGGALGVSSIGCIRVRPDLTAAEKFSVLSHELAHELLHERARRKEASKTVLEIEAEAVSYVVARAVGIDCLARASDYIKLYSGDKDVLLESLDRIQKTACLILDGLYKLSDEKNDLAANKEERQ